MQLMVRTKSSSKKGSRWIGDMRVIGAQGSMMCVGSKTLVCLVGSHRISKWSTNCKKNVNAEFDKKVSVYSLLYIGLCSYNLGRVSILSLSTM